MSIFEISSSEKKKKKNDFPLSLPDLWANYFWVVHYLAQMAKRLGHQRQKFEAR